MKSKFTLIELLVVIAIISILMAMLLPSLKSAKDFSRQSTCLSGLKQLALAVTNYADDYDGYMPQVWSGTETWFVAYPGNKGLLMPYVGSKYGSGSIFWCPSNSNGYSGQTNYVANRTVLGGFGDGPYKISSLRRPDKSVFFLDASTTMGGNWPGYWTDNTAALTVHFPSPHHKGLGHSIAYADGHANSILNLKISTDLTKY